MLDFHLAALYGVETRVLNQAVKRNSARFPQDFMFRLSAEEAAELSPQPTGVGISSQIVMRSPARRGKSYLPYAFTEQGVAMLSGVLRSPRAVQVNVGIMRAFVHLRRLLLSHADLARQLADMEKKYDRQFKVVFDAIRQLMAAPSAAPGGAKPEIGFHVREKSARYTIRRRLKAN
jgi:hypothetical protein